MTRRVFLLFLVCATAALGLSSVSKRKTYSDGQIFTASDYNADIDESVTWINALNAKFPGTDPNDSVKTTLAAHDTLVTKGIAKIMIKSPLVSVDSGDSLVFDWAHIDTIWIGVATRPILNFSGGTTAGVRLNFGSVVRADSIWAGTTTPVVGFPMGASAGARATFGSLVAIDSLRVRDSLQVSPGARAMFPRARIDTLLVGSATATVGFTHGFSPAGARTTFASLVAIDSLRVRDSLQVSPGARAHLPRARVDTLLLGSATATVGFSGAASAGQRVTFGSLVGVDSLRVRDSLTVSPGARAMVPRARIDTLLIGSAIATVGYSGSASAGQRLTFGSLVAIDSLRVRDSLQVVPGARAFLPRMRTDTLLLGAATVTVGYSMAASAGQRATFGSLVAIDSLRIRDSLQVSPGARAYLPRLRTDTLMIGAATPTVGFSLSASAGQRATFGSMVGIDSLRLRDSLTAAGPATFLGVANVATATNWKLANTAYTGSMANLNTLRDGSDAAGLHKHGTDDLTQLRDSIEVALDDSVDVKGRTITGPVRLTNLQQYEARADSARYVFIDTTIALSVKHLVAVNLHDPAQAWDYDALRAAETNTSLFRTDAKRVPDVALLVSRTAGDSLSWIDALNPSVTATRLYLKAASNVLGNVAINGIDYKDGVIWLAQAGTLTKIDELADQATQWTTSGQYDYNARLSSRNAASGYLLLKASPAIVNNTVNAVAAIRSPWLMDGHRDVLGRQIQYFVIGTGGVVSIASYNSNGTLSIYDEGSVAWTSRMVAFTQRHHFHIYYGGGTNNFIGHNTNFLSLTGDSWSRQDGWSINNSGSEDLRWPAATVIADVVALDGASESGNNSPRIYAVADSGMYILDAKANDNTNGSKQEINARYVSPVMVGNVMVAFSPASTAQIGSTPGITTNSSSELPTFTVAANGPLSHYASFNGLDDFVIIDDDDSLSFVSGQNLSISCWVNFTDATNSTIISKWVQTTGSEQMEWLLGTDATDYLEWKMSELNGSGLDGIEWQVAFPQSSWHYIVATYNGGDDTNAFAIWVDGIQVPGTSLAAGPWDGSNNGTALTQIGHFTGPAGTAGNRYDGSMTLPVLAREVLTAQQIQDAYQRSLRMIQSPSPDTLYTAAVTDIAANPYTGDLCLVHSGSVEIRDKWGALVDTLVCSTCGTLADCDFFRIAGVDSLGGGVAFGGSLGTRIVVPDVRAWDLAQARYNYTPYVIEQPAVVDSTGFGDFWTLNDAVAAVNNVSRNFVQVLRGAYPAATISQAGMVVEGAGDTLTVFDGLAAAAGLTVSGADVTVRNLGARTTPAGGSAFDAFVVTGARFRGEGLRALGADDECFDVNAAEFYITGAVAHRCDDRGFLFGTSADNGVVEAVVKDQAGTSVVFSDGGSNLYQLRTDGAISGGSGNVNVGSSAVAF